MIRRLLVCVALGGTAWAAAASPALAATCSQYPSQQAAQDAYRNDPQGLSNLDADHDGVACEDNPAPYDRNPVSQQSAATTAAPAVQAAPSNTLTSPDGSITATFTTAAPSAPVRRVAASTARRSTVANTGPNDYLWFVAAGGLVLAATGARMRGRRAAGAHWLP
jgi:hypothetical protein